MTTVGCVGPICVGVLDLTVYAKHDGLAKSKDLTSIEDLWDYLEQQQVKHQNRSPILAEVQIHSAEEV